MRFAFFLLLCLTAVLLHAQVDYTTFLFGDPLSNNRGSASVVVNDTVWYAGTISNGADGSDDIAVFCIAPDGSMVWQYTFGDGRNEFVNNMMLCTDARLYICGDVRNVVSGDLDGFVMAMDKQGTLLWRTDHGTDSLEEDFYGIDCLQSDALAITGFITSETGTGNDILLARYTTGGVLINSMHWGDALNDYGMGISVLPGGSIVISGDRQLPDGNYNAFYTKVLPDNTIDFDVLFESDFNSGCKNMHLSDDGSLMICGETASALEAQFDVMFARADTSGNILIHTQYPGIGPEAGYDIAALPGAKFGIAGFGYNALTAENDILYLLVNSDGTEYDRYYYGDMGADVAYDIQTNTEGDAWISGFSTLDDASYFALIFQEFTPVAITDPVTGSASVEIYPQPVKDCFRLSAGYPVTGISLLSASGYVIAACAHMADNTWCLPENMPAGLYVLRIETPDAVYHKKIIAG